MPGLCSCCVSDYDSPSSAPSLRETREFPPPVMRPEPVIDDSEKIRRYKRKHPPNHFTLEIMYFDSLRTTKAKEYEFKVFKADDHKWRLSLHPNAKIDGDDYISLFLKIEDTAGRIDQVVYATFRLFALDKEKKKYLTVEDGKVRGFSKSDPMFGFKKFISHTTFKDEYIRDGCCIFGAEVFVHQPKPESSVESLLLRKPAPSVGIVQFKFMNFRSKDLEDYLSPEFRVEGRKWKLRIYPKGTNQKNDSGPSLSIFLRSAEDFKTHESLYVEFKLRVVDQVNGKKSFVEPELKHWFSSESYQHGCPSLRRSKRFIKNDVLIIEVEFIAVSSVANPPAGIPDQIIPF